VQRVYLKGRWQAEKIIAKDSRENFTIHLEDDNLYLFCQDSDGDIISVTINASNDSIVHKVMLKNQSGQVSDVFLHPIVSEEGLSIIYNAADPEDNSNCIMMRNNHNNGEWSHASQIDKCQPGDFEVQRISGKHMLLFYQKRTPDNVLGYKEVTPNKQGKFNAYYTTNHVLSDNSCLTTDNNIHVIFVVKGMFSSQLIYRRNVTGEFSAPLLICEAKNIDRCLLFFVENTLYITFLTSGNLFMCKSNDKGETFSRPERYLNKFCQNPEKACYISQLEQSESSMYLRQIYVDPSAAWDVQLIPELFEDFFPVFSETTETNESYDVEPVQADELERLKNQIAQLQNHTFEKDMQIMELMQQISKQNEELADVNQRLMAFASQEKL